MRIPKGTTVTVFTIYGEKLTGKLAWTYEGRKDALVFEFGSGTFVAALGGRIESIEIVNIDIGG